MPRYIRTILIWGSIVLGGLVGLVVAAFLVLSYFGESRLNQTYEIQPAAITVPTGDDEAIERGRHLNSCHGHLYGMPWRELSGRRYRGRRPVLPFSPNPPKDGLWDSP